MFKTLVILFVVAALASVSIAQTDSSVVPTSEASNPTSEAPQSTSGSPVASTTSGAIEPTSEPFNPTTTITPCNCPQEPHFDVGSFFGGMLLAAGLVLIGYLIWYFAYGRKHSQAHSYSHFG